MSDPDRGPARPEPDRARFVEVNRGRLRLWEWGDPTHRPVVLVHGGWDHGRMWDGFAPLIAGLGFRAVAVDMRGHGDSSRLHAGNWLNFNLDVACVIRELGPPAGLVGHSFGGGQCLSVASAFPELVAWVLNIDGLGPPPEMFLVEDHAAMAAAWLGDAESVSGSPQREYASIEEMAAKRKAINRRLPLEWCEHLARHGTRAGPGGGLIWKSDPAFRVGMPVPFTFELIKAGYARIRCPVLALTGGEDDQWSDMPPEQIAERVASIPGCEHHAVPGAGHYVHVEQPQAALSHLRGFLERVNA